MPPIVFNMSSQGEKLLIDKIRQLEGRVETLQGKLKDVGTAGKSAFSGIEKEIIGVVKQFVGPVSLAGAVMAVTNELKKAYEIMLKNRELSRDVHLDIGKARGAALANVASDFMGGVSGLDKMAGEFQKRGGRMSEFWKMLPSGQGAKNKDQLMGAMMTAHDIEEQGGGDAKTLLGGIIKAQNITGMKKPEEILGWLKRNTAASGITSMEGQMGLMRTAISGELYGDKPKEALKIQSTIARLIGDKEGDRASKAYGRFLQKSERDIIPYETVDSKTGKNKIDYKSVEGENTIERLANLQKWYAGANDKDKQLMLEKLKTKPEVEAFVLNALKDTGRYKSISEEVESRSKISGTDERRGKDFIESLSRGPYGAAVQSAATGEAKKEAAYSKRTPDQINAEATKQFNEAMQLQGWGNTLVNIKGAQTFRELAAAKNGGNLASVYANDLETGGIRQFLYKDKEGIERLVKALDKLGSQYEQAAAEEKRKKSDKQNPNSQEAE